MAKGYRSPDTDNLWLRDHVYQMQGFKYWEEDMTSLVEFFLRDQTASGSLNDLECPGGRIGTESDVEYWGVLGAFTAWQATGNDAWLESVRENLEQALHYSTTDKYRWDKTHGLVKRPFTIDTWDFQWGDGSPEINDNTRFGIMSGDNSGLYLAARFLGQHALAQSIKTKANALLWNNARGYYRSFFHLEPPTPPVDINEDAMLSFSNILNVNRGDFVDQKKAERIIQEYIRRGKWYSINPDYGDGKFGTAAQKSGEYVNGGIFPFIGGELAKAELTRGYENEGVKELKKYIELLKKDNNKTYLWYWPDGKPGIYQDTIPTDGWGSSAFLSAFIEGLVGIRDLDRAFNVVELAPRWPAAGISHADVRIGYGAGDAYIAYTYTVEKNTIKMEVEGSGSTVRAHILLPEETESYQIHVNGQPRPYTTSRVRESRYADFSFSLPKTASITPRAITPFAFDDDKFHPLLRAAGRQEVFYITDEGTKMHIQNEQAFAVAGFDFKQVWIVSPDRLDSIETDSQTFDPALAKPKATRNILLILGIILLFCYAIFTRIPRKTVG